MLAAVNTAVVSSRVVLLSWPREAARAEQLADAARPRLLLVEPGAAPPPANGELQDWVRLPADEHEVALRVRRLARLAGERRR